METEKAETDRQKWEGGGEEEVGKERDRVREAQRERKGIEGKWDRERK